MHLFCTSSPSPESQLALCHCGTQGSGHDTRINQLQCLEATLGCKVGHWGLGQERSQKREELAFLWLFHRCKATTEHRTGCESVLFWGPT